MTGDESSATAVNGQIDELADTVGRPIDRGTPDASDEFAPQPSERSSAVVPSSARTQVAYLSLARDDRPATAVDGHQPTVLGSFEDGSGQIMFELFNKGEVETKSLQEMLSTGALAQQVLVPNVAPNPDAEILHWIDAEARAEALRVQADLVDVIDGRPEGDASKDAHLYLTESTSPTSRRKAKMAERGWNASKMSRRERAYRERGIVGLIPHSGRKTQMKNVIDVPTEILAVIREHCQGRHLSSKKDLYTEYGSVIADLRRRGMVSRTPGTPGPEGTELPLVKEVLPYHRFVDVLRQLDGGRSGRTGKTRYEQSKRPVAGPLRHEAYDFGQMLQVDSTPADFFVRGPDGKPRRVHAVFAVCVSTKMVWMRLVDEPPRGRDLALLLFDVLGGHGMARAEECAPLTTVPRHLRVNAFPPNAGPPPGVLPGVIRLDHGAEEENQLWIGLCAQLFIGLHWAATATPTDKAHVESLISTFARDCQLVPSHKGNTVLNRPQFIAPDGLPTFEQATLAFRQWQAWMANQPHTGLQVGTTNRYITPLQAVHTSLRYGNPVGVLADPTLALRLLPTKLLQPQDDGVTWERRRYWCEDYKDLIVASTTRGKRRRLVFFYDPQAKHRLYWIEPGTFNVRRLSSKGADSGVQPAFGGVRKMIADVVGLSDEPWRTHTEVAESRADLAEQFEQNWNRDGLNPGENVVALRPKVARTKRKGPSAATELDNGGWRLEDFDPDPVPDPEAPDFTSYDSPESARSDWEAGIVGASHDGATSGAPSTTRSDL